MHHSCVVGVRIASSAAAVVGLVVVQFATSTSSYADNGTVVAVDLTPTPSTAPVVPGLSQLSPVPIATPAVDGQTAPMAPSPSQQASDRIAEVSQQVADAVHDPSLAI